jgi:hypothetical protein
MVDKDNPTAGELKTIAQMLKYARKEGLEVEVVWSMACNVRAGEKDFFQAAQNALCDWDI